MNSEWSGEGETGKHRVKTPQTQALIYTQNKNRSAPNRPGYRHASYHPTDRWQLKGWLGPHVAYHHWWPAKWQFLYLIVFSPLGRPLVLFCIAIDEWCQGTSAGQPQHPRGYDPKASKFVLWFSSRGLGSNICSNDSALSPPHLIPHRILKFIMRLSIKNEREKVCATRQ